jgi:catechol 2,3-dioxygenase-like lactoylglutathione lyase family enzyme
LRSETLSGVAVLGVNHVAFRSPNPARLRAFYERLLGAETVQGTHDPLRVGGTLLVFFEADGPVGEDELAFDVDALGFEETLQHARDMGLSVRGPVEHTGWSKGFYVEDPDGRRVEITFDDRAVYWQE